MKKNLVISILIWCTATLLCAQIDVNSNGYVRVGNSNILSAANPNARLAVAGIISPNSITGVLPIGIQIIPSIETISFASKDVMVLIGFSGQTASIGRVDNQMSRVYSNSFRTNGATLGVISSSDANLKTNIRELSLMTERISKLRPVMYDFVKNSSGEDVSKDPAYQNRVGFIAQEMQEFFPDLVVVDENELLSLDYAGLIPYLTKVIQEQNERIEKLEQQIDFATTFDIDMPKNNAPQQTSSAAIQTTTEYNILYQNFPNPFNNITTINYRLSDNVKSAKICIYNLTGKQLQCYELPAIKGENTIEVRASSLQSGMYLYSLIVDGRLIDTKRMILTE
jgi:hypothetical protein